MDNYILVSAVFFLGFQKLKKPETKKTCTSADLRYKLLTETHKFYGFLLVSIGFQVTTAPLSGWFCGLPELSKPLETNMLNY
jgi:hypothetical protein